MTASTAILESARLSVKDGDLLFNTDTTREITVGDTTFTISGVEGEDERPGIALVNTNPGTDSFTGEVRFYSGSTLVATASSRTDGATDAGLLSFFTRKTGGAITLTLRLTSLKNLILGGGVASGANGEKVFVLGTGTPPTTSPEDSWQTWSQDFVAGNACPHFMTENTDVIKLAKGAALTTSDGTLANAVVRIGQLEARLQALGLLG